MNCCHDAGIVAAKPLARYLDVFTLPNLLTLLRLLLAPVVAWRLLAHDVEGAFWLFVIAALTDLLDGSLARWLNQRSVLGAWLDPIADKVMLLTTFAMLALTGLLPMWLLYVVLVRDAVILAGAEGYRRLTGRLDVRPTWSGKIATFMEFVLVSLVLADVALDLGLSAETHGLVLLTAAATLLSGARYVWIWSRKTRDFLREHSHD